MRSNCSAVTLCVTSVLRVSMFDPPGLNEYVGSLDSGEADQFEADGIAPGREVGRDVLPARIGDERPDLSSLYVCGDDDDAGNGAALLIRDATRQRAEPLLGRGHPRRPYQDEGEDSHAKRHSPRFARQAVDRNSSYRPEHMREKRIKEKGARRPLC